MYVHTKLIDRYVLREVVPPFLVGLLLVTFVLLMNQVLLLAELFIDKGVPLLQAVRILGLLVPSLLVFALPMAVLMGILGGLARLSADSEIVAFRSLGVGPRRLARPLVLFGLAGFLLTLPLALFFAPRANHAWVRTMTDSVLARVRLKVEPLEFNETLPDMVFLVRDVGRDKVWHDVFAYMGKDPLNPRIVMARTGTVRLFPEERRAVLELADGRVYSGPLAAPGEDTLTAFERLEEEIDVEGLFAAVTSEKRVREKDIGELIRDLGGLEAGRPAGAAGIARDPRPPDRDPQEDRPARRLPRVRPPRPAARAHDRPRRADGRVLARAGHHPPLLRPAHGRREGGHGRPPLRPPRDVGAQHRAGRRGPVAFLEVPARAFLLSPAEPRSGGAAEPGRGPGARRGLPALRPDALSRPPASLPRPARPICLAEIPGHPGSRPLRPRRRDPPRHLLRRPERRPPARQAGRPSRRLCLVQAPRVPGFPPARGRPGGGPPRARAPGPDERGHGHEGQRRQRLPDRPPGPRPRGGRVRAGLPRPGEDRPGRERQGRSGLGPAQRHAGPELQLPQPPLGPRPERGQDLSLRLFRSRLFDVQPALGLRHRRRPMGPGRRLFAAKASFEGNDLATLDGWTRDYAASPGPPFVRTASGRIDAAGDKDGVPRALERAARR